MQKKTAQQYAHKTIHKLNIVQVHDFYKKSDKRFRKTSTVQNATTELAQKEIFIYCKLDSLSLVSCFCGCDLAANCIYCTLQKGSVIH